jgi:hypothetical protein
MRHWRLFLLFLLGALWMAYVSAPFAIPWKEKNIPFTIGYFTYHLAPMFRALARAGIFVSMFVAGMCAVVIAQKRKDKPHQWNYKTVTLLLAVLIFDFWSVSPDFFQPTNPPRAYEWLSEQPGDFIIALYPMVAADTTCFNETLFWQRVHGKRMVNGAMPNNGPAWRMYQEINDLSKPTTVQKLKDVGVKYIVVNVDGYREGRIPRTLKRYYPPEMAGEIYNNGIPPKNPLLRDPLMKFENDVVYQLDP